MRSALYALLQALLSLLLAPLLGEWIEIARRALARRLRARASEGSVSANPLSALAPLLTRPAPASLTRSLAPAVALACSLCLTLLVPTVRLPSPLGFAGDTLLAAGLLGLAWFSLALAAFEVGHPLGRGALALPAPLVALLALAPSSGSTHFDAMVAGAFAARGLLDPSRLAALGAFALSALAVSGARTDLERAFSGARLALLELARLLAQFALLSLTANLFLPWGLARAEGLASLALGFFALLGKLALLGAALGAARSFVPRVRLSTALRLHAAGLALAVLSFLFAAHR